jgi:hypothetical protein
MGRRKVGRKKGGKEESLEKLKNDNRTDHLVKYDGEGIQQKEVNKIKMQIRKRQEKRGVIKVSKK